jgi:hypothetical protein
MLPVESSDILTSASCHYLARTVKFPLLTPFSTGYFVLMILIR